MAYRDRAETSSRVADSGRRDIAHEIQRRNRSRSSSDVRVTGTYDPMRTASDSLAWAAARSPSDIPTRSATTVDLDLDLVPAAGPNAVRMQARLIAMSRGEGSEEANSVVSLAPEEPAAAVDTSPSAGRRRRVRWAMC